MAKKALASGKAATGRHEPKRDVVIRAAASEDIAAIVELDEAETGQKKHRYWDELFTLFSQDKTGQRPFLVAEFEGRVVGFITGEIRAFEFGAQRCGWVFAVTVDPAMRVRNVGTRLFDEICKIFARAGAVKVSTLIERDDNLVMAFFRSQGMMVGRFLEMERDIERDVE